MFWHDTILPFYVMAHCMLRYHIFVSCGYSVLMRGLQNPLACKFFTFPTVSDVHYETYTVPSDRQGEGESLRMDLLVSL